MKPIHQLLHDLTGDRFMLPLFMPSLLFGFAQGLLIPVLPLYAGTFEISYGLIGLILAGESLGMMLGDLPGGILSRWLSTKGVHVLGFGCAAITTLALFWATTVPQVIVLRVLAGAGTALYQVSRHSFIANSINNADRGKPTAFLAGLIRTGLFLGPAAGGVLAAAFGLRLPFVICAAALGAALFCVFFFLPPDTPRAPNKLTRDRDRDHREQLLKVMSAYGIPLATAGIGRLFAQLIRTGRRVIIPLYAADILGLNVEAIGIIISVSAATEMTLFYPAGIILDRLGRKHSIVPSFLIQGVGMLLLPLTGSFATLLLASILMGLGNGLSAGSMLSLGADLAPAHSPDLFLGTWWLIGDVGASGGPLIVGAIADLFTFQTTAVALASTGFITVLIFGLFVPETLKKPHQTESCQMMTE